MTLSPSVKRVGTAVSIGAVVLVVLTLWWNHFSPEGKRRARVEAARIHARDVLTPLLAKQPRFAEVRATEWWKDDGYLRLKGGVETEADLQDLKQLVMSTHPPAPVAWEVDVFGKGSATTNVP